MKQTYQYFPLYICMEGQTIVVFGAGHVAARRVEKLLCTPAHIRIIAPAMCDAMKKLQEQYPEQLEYSCDRYRPGCLQAEDMRFVFALTDDRDVNAAIVRECRHRQIFVNNASDHTLCDFYFPATLAHDPLLIAIASSQAVHETHGMTKQMRQTLQEILGDKDD